METASKKEPPKKQPPEPPRKSRKKPPAERLQIISAAFTQERAATLAAMAQRASDELGRTISPSAVLRALVSLVEKEVIPAPSIIGEIERELTTGKRWGGVRQRLTVDGGEKAGSNLRRRLRIGAWVQRRTV